VVPEALAVGAGVASAAGELLVLPPQAATAETRLAETSVNIDSPKRPKERIVPARMQIPFSGRHTKIRSNFKNLHVGVTVRTPARSSPAFSNG
jgi:hypothetical protein